jgi:FMN-dependent oxidoreductase (nitrilotriacetate monooxygenase family)
MAERMMSLGLLLHATGSHPASWLDPSSNKDGSTSIQHYTRMAQMAEAAKFDMLFIADTPAARTSNLHAWSRYPMFMNVFEPVPLLSAVAMGTTHIGLGGTTSTSFTEPYNLARQFASLDHISGGRAAWNVVTSANDYAARNFGLDKLPPHDKRYDKARDFIQVVQALWDTWEDDAFIKDRGTGVYFDPAKQHVLDYNGPYFKVHGALNIARSPQGQPVIIQAGQSEDGRQFAAATAEVVFSSANTLAKAQAFYGDMKARVLKFGRSPDQIKILPGISPIVGETQEEADRKYEYLQSLVHPEVGRQFLAEDLEADLSGLPLDQPIPAERIPKSSNLHQAYFAHIVEMIDEGLTLGEIAKRYNRGRNVVRGTAQKVVDSMEEWFHNGGADGFMFSPQTVPDGLEQFTRLVVPELQRRGLFRTEYAGKTLREHLGLARPENRYVKTAPAAGAAAD